MAEQSAEPAAKKQKLEDKDPLWMLSPSELKRIVDFVHQKSATAMDVDAMKQILKEAEAEFLPDVSKYKDKIYVSLHIDLSGGEANRSKEPPCRFRCTGRPTVLRGDAEYSASSAAGCWRSLTIKRKTPSTHGSRRESADRLNLCASAPGPCPLSLRSIDCSASNRVRTDLLAH